MTQGRSRDTLAGSDISLMLPVHLGMIIGSLLVSQKYAKGVYFCENNRGKLPMVAVAVCAQPGGGGRLFFVRQLFCLLRTHFST